MTATNGPTFPLATIVITTYNHAPFLPAAIESALNQTHPRVEVIVVDDGSTDESPQVISRYGTRISSLSKKNEGADAGRNDGFALSKGEIVCFLDADDTLQPTAIEHAVAALADSKVAKVQWRLWTIDEDGRTTGRSIPRLELDEGNLREVVIALGPQSYRSSPTSGNAYPRWFLDRVFPIPEDMEQRSGASDDVLSMLAPLFGRVKALGWEGSYRIHANNDYWGRSIDVLDVTVRDYNRCCELLRNTCMKMGIHVDVSWWQRTSWFCTLRAALQELLDIVPPGDAFILVDGDQWGCADLVAGRRRLPFVEHEGLHWGKPIDDEHAIAEVERLRAAGAHFLVVGWSAFWWREYYASWFEHLRSSFRCVLHNERLQVFDLKCASH
jgi:glycosyltransferase involved in cell wall biosynthesis